MAGENYGGDAGGAIGAMMQTAMPFAQYQFNNDLMQRQSAINLKNAMLMGEYNMANAYKYWEATGVKAQLRLQKEAGLSPGLMQSKGAGAGGQLQGQGNPAPGNYGNIMMPNIVETMLAGAQIDALKAKAEKDRADAEKTSGVDTEEVKTRIDNLAQDTNNKVAQEALTKAQTYVTKLEGDYRQQTFDDAVDRIKYDTERAMHETKIAKYEGNLKEETYREAVNIIKQQEVEAYLKNDLLRADIMNTNADTENIKASTKQIKQATQQIIQEMIESKGSGDRADFEANTERLRVKIQAALGRAGLELGESALKVETVKAIFRAAGDMYQFDKGMEQRKVEERGRNQRDILKKQPTIQVDLRDPRRR